MRRQVMAKKKRKSSRGRKAPGCHCPSTWRGKRVTAKGGGCRVKGHKGSVKKVGKDCKR